MLKPKIWVLPINSQNGQNVLKNLSDPVRSSSTRPVYPGLLANARHWPEKGLLREFPLSCTIHSLKAVVFALLPCPFI
jgi:hypothetical protein